MWAIRSLHSPRNRAERLIATWRAVLAAASLLAIWLDPSEPSKHAETAYTLLIVYLAYALLLLLLTWGSLRSPPRHLGIVTHVIDLAAFTLLLYFTEGATSPFFVYYVFSLFCAAARWQRSGAFWTTLAVLALYSGMGIVMDLVLHDPHFELDRFIIRSAYLAVVGFMLAYLTAYEQRTRENLAKLADWPESGHVDGQALIRETLRYGAEVMQAPKALLVWDEPDEPYRHLACVADDTFEWVQESPIAYEPLVAAALAEIDFISPDAAARSAVLCGPAAQLRRLPSPPLHPELQSRFAIRQVCSLAVRGERFNGRLFFIGKASMSDDDLYLGALVANLTVAAMNRLFMQQRLQQAGSSEERIRLARDLHDGLLQSLTGIALQMELLRRPQQGDEAWRQQRLAEIQELIAEEQRGLRTFIQQLKPPVAAPAAADGRQPDLQDLAAGIERRWGVQVQLTVQPPAVEFPAALEYDIRYLLHEALVNSAKHGQPSLIRAEVAVREGRVWLSVADDGHGFPFHGRYRLDQLGAMKAGPRSLQERVLALGGDLTIDSSAAGSTVELSVPWLAALASSAWPGVQHSLHTSA